MKKLVSKALRYVLAVLPATHTRTVHSCLQGFTPLPQSITALWLVLNAPNHKDGQTELTSVSIEVSITIL